MLMRHGKKLFEIKAGDCYGHWNVLQSEPDSRQQPAMLSCRCRCGKVKKVRVINLISGLSTSCGCRKIELAQYRVTDLSGITYGDHVVLYRTINKNTPGRTYWTIKCRHCGHHKKAFAGNITAGVGGGCRCQEIERAQHNIDSFWKGYIGAYVNGAKLRKLAWELDEDAIRAIAAQDCAYCGAKPARRKAHWRSFCVVNANGLDRVDSTKGYIAGNVAPCCPTCNAMKSDMPAVSFVRHCHAVAKNHASETAEMYSAPPVRLRLKKEFSPNTEITDDLKPFDVDLARRITTKSTP